MISRGASDDEDVGHILSRGHSPDWPVSPRNRVWLRRIPPSGNPSHIDMRCMHVCILLSFILTPFVHRLAKSSTTPHFTDFQASFSCQLLAMAELTKPQPHQKARSTHSSARTPSSFLTKWYSLTIVMSRHAAARPCDGRACALTFPPIEMSFHYAFLYLLGHCSALSACPYLASRFSRWTLGRNHGLFGAFTSESCPWR